MAAEGDEGGRRKDKWQEYFDKVRTDLNMVMNTSVCSGMLC